MGQRREQEAWQGKVRVVEGCVAIVCTNNSQTGFTVHALTDLLGVGDLLWGPLQVGDVGKGDTPLEGGGLWETNEGIQGL